MTTPNPQAQLAAALKALETVMSQGEAEFKQSPEQFRLLKALYAEIKQLKPGQAPSAQFAGLLQTFLAQRLDAEIKAEKQSLQRSQGARGPAAVEIKQAHGAALQALTTAQEGLGALAPANAGAMDGAVARSTHANAQAAAAIDAARAAEALAKRGK